MADPFIGEIRMFGCNFAPNGWATCDGQILPINQNTALFSLLGTYYGGNGTSNFALPNLQGAFPIGQGQGPGLSLRSIGETGGSAAVTLLETQIPGHSHVLAADISATTNSPAGASLAPTANGAAAYRIPGVLASMATGAVLPTGGSQPHENRQPFLGMIFCIALQGIYPSRP